MLRNASKKTPQTNQQPKQMGGTAKLVERRISAFPFPNALAKTFVALGKLYLPTAKFLQPNCPVQGSRDTTVKCLREMV